MTVKCDTVPGVLPSRLVEYLEAKLRDASKDWPAGYHFAFGGEKEEQAQGLRLDVDRDGRVGAGDLPGLGPPVQQPDQAAGGLRGGALRHGRRPDGADRLRRARSGSSRCWASRRWSG